jgi:hypothetical protein
MAAKKASKQLKGSKKLAATKPLISRFPVNPC